MPRPRNRRPGTLGLTDLERTFVSAYFKAGCSVVRACEAIGKEPNEGYSLLSRRVVRDALEKRHARMSIGANEVISRLAAQARCTLDDVLDDAGDFDLPKARKTGAIHQIKRHEVKTTTHVDKEGGITTERTVKIEMENRQGALGLLARYHSLLTDVVALRGLPTDERSLKALLLAELQRVNGVLPPAAARLLDELTPFAVRIQPENFRAGHEADLAARAEKEAEAKKVLPLLGAGE